MFEVSARASPEAIAVELGDQRVSYRALNERATRIAHRLRRLGVGPESLVGLCVNRTPDAIAAILGILASDGAYVPLDPTYPRQRLASMLDDAEVRVVITERSLLPVLPPLRAELLLLDDEANGLDDEPEGTLERLSFESNLAYVLYTSGSTGRSKGVAMPHGPVVNLLRWQIENLIPPGPARTLHFASLSFDVSFQEICSTLCSGGTLIIVPEALRRDPPGLARLLVEREVERAYLPPIVLEHLAEASLRLSLPPLRLRQIITAGEALRISRSIAAFVAQLEGCVLQNQYGPTETHVVTAFTLPSPLELGLPSIGRPIANVEAHLLDDRLRPVAAGEIGELYFGGACVARGYLRRPELSSERFLADPTGGPGRLYKTGDRARLLPDGTLEFLGRNDHQVKIRGHRVELGEIEAALAEHPRVKQAVVTTRENEGGDKRLVAYVVPSDPASSFDASELRAHLRERLPGPLLPSEIVKIDAIPLLPNGKTDRASLPEPPSSSERPFTAPRTEVEQLLAGIWAEVLGLDRVGVDDDFLSLGGHSLHAGQIVARAAAALAVELPPNALFEAPTVALLAAHIEAARQREPASDTAPIRPRARSIEPLISPAQRNLWLNDRLDPGLATYIIPQALHIEGPLDAEALERALTEIVRRHESLRTTFPRVDGEPRQRIASLSSFTVSRFAITTTSPSEATAEAERRAQAEARLPFDLERGPLFRATLLRLAERSHLLLLTMHHIVADGWSLRILGAELSALYAAFSTGRPSPLAELSLQVADLAAWQHERRSERALAPQLARWKEHLADAPQALSLPTDRPRPAEQSHRGRTHRFLLPRELSAALDQLCRREGVTLFVALLAAFELLLHRLSGQDDLLLGTVDAGRDRVEMEGLIGCFVTTLVLRSHLDGDPTFRAMLQRARETTLGAFAQRDLPFDRLVAELAPARDLSRTPLFQAMLVLEHTSVIPLSLGEAKVRSIEVERGTAILDLTLAVEETAEGLACALEYASDLFDHSTIARMALHFTTLLEGAVADPLAPIHTLPLLSADEQRALAHWNDTATAYPRERAIHRLFEDQVERAPGAVALCLGSAVLRYQDLNRRANQLARTLVRRGARAGTPIGLLLPRSLETIVAMLAVLKAGGAYVPLDPTLPPARLTWLARDAGVPLLISLGPLPEGLAPEIARLHLDEEAESLALEDADNLPPAAGGDSLAYIMYTSGSTGTPKGVSVPQRGVVRLVMGTDYARFAPDETFLHLAPAAFDASTFEIWGALLHGARLVLFPGDRPSIDEIGDVIRLYGVTTLWLTAALFNAVIDTRPEALAPLRQLLVGGEALSVPHVQKALAALRHVTLINGYGPTEGTTFSCCFHVTQAEGLSSIPIGHPIANTTAHVLDRHASPLPVGVPGELYLGGDGLALGYLHDPELTRRRFLPDPFSADPGARLYRTGDRVRRLPDGTLDFLGRLDEQLKIRGFRIEPGEIEAALTALPSVKACVVVARDTAEDSLSPAPTPAPTTDKRLVAYVVLDNGAPSLDALRDALASTLPEYLIPAAFVRLDALPLSANGKVDRRALPRPEAREGRAPSNDAPRTPMEQLLAGLWTELLHAEHVGTGDHFFALGGHSLLATRLLARLGALLGVELPLRALFEAPTLAGFAARIEASRAQSTQRPPPPLVARPRPATLPLSFAQQRLWLLDRLHPGDATYIIPLALRIEGPIDRGAIEQSLAEILRRHEALRTTFSFGEGEARQHIAAPSPFTLPLVALTAPAGEAREAEARRWVAEEAKRPFDLARGPLFRATLLRLDERGHLLLMTMHHIVSDGWSLGLLLHELSTLYLACSTGQTSPLPEPPVQYADYALWQRAWLSDETRSAQIAYWKEQLAGAPAVLDLPSDRPRPAVQRFAGETHVFSVAREIAEALRALARREGVTLFMTVLAALQLLLQRYTGQDDLVVGSPIAGRARVETEGLIGFFVNTLALRTHLDGDPSFRELLARVREVTLSAYAHQDLPFEQLVEALAPTRDLGRTPLFQVLLVVNELEEHPLSLGEAQVTRLPVDTGTAKFDLTLAVEETAEGLACALEYASDLFDPSTIAGMARHLTSILSGCARDPSLTVGAVPLLDDAERTTLLHTWNGAALPLPERTTLHDVFARQVLRTPDAVALIDGRERLGYARLHTWASAIAHRLRALGVGPGVLVGVSVHRGAALVAALLGILQAGGAYVPLDPTYPDARLAQIVDQARLHLVVADALARPKLPIGLTTLTPDEPAPDAPFAPLDSSASPSDLAYVLFTSGSTGTPKGVAIEHRNAVALLTWAERVFSAAELNAVLFATSIAFDLSVFEIFLPLSVGGALVLAENALALPSLPAAREVTLINTVPSAMAELLRLGAVPASVRAVCLAGEPLSANLASAVHALPFIHSLYNLYGPTEATTYATCSLVPRDARAPTIGRPIANTYAYLLDSSLQPVPLGVTAELYLGGAGVARGYLHQPELTHERFLPNPFVPGDRLYRTGDLARFLPSGELVFLGRKDHQIKLRGFRIELGEVEAVLRSFEGVRDALAICREDSPGDPRLVAYVVLDGEASTAGDLRARASSRSSPATWCLLPS